MVKLANNKLVTQENSASLWEGASFIINLAREKQLHTEHKFVGPVYIAKKLRKDILKFINTDPIAKAVCDKREIKTAAVRLIERFEELCRRREINIKSPIIRSYAYRQLLLDLHINSSTTKIPAGKLVTITLLNNELIASLFDDKAFKKFLASCPSLINLLSERNPANLRYTLRTAESRTQSILKDPHFKLFRNWPGVVRRIVLQRGNTYKQYLDEIQSCIKSQIKKHRPHLNGREATAVDLFTRYGINKAERELLRLLSKQN